MVQFPLPPDVGARLLARALARVRAGKHLFIDLGGEGSGNFGHAGRPGEVGGSSDADGGQAARERLHAERASGVARVEALLDRAVQKSDFIVQGKGEPDYSDLEIEWDDVEAKYQDQAREKFVQDSFDNGVDVDDSEIIADLEKDLRRNNDDVIKDAERDMLSDIEGKFPHENPSLPEMSPVGRTIDPETIVVGDDTGDGAPLHDDELRFTDGTELTDREKQIVTEAWDENYTHFMDAAQEKVRESDEYYEQRSELESETIDSEWNNLSDSEKLGYLSDQGKDSALEDAMERQGSTIEEETYDSSPPDRWMIDTEVDESTGRATNEAEREDYDKSRILARQLSNMRTEEILTERGLSARNADTMAGDIWGAWKGSSTSPLGLALQLATAEELGGVHRLTADEEKTARAAAESSFSTREAFEDVPQERQAEIRQKFVDEMAAHNLQSWEITQTNAGTSPTPAEKQAKSEKITQAWSNRWDTTLKPYEKTSYAAEKNLLLVQSGMDRLKAYVRGQWETTQFLMEKAGQTHAELYRGIVIPKEQLDQTTNTPVYPTNAEGKVTDTANSYLQLPDATVLRNGAASTSSNASISNNWGGAGGWNKQAKDSARAVIRFKAPATSLISLPVFGANLHNESEYVIAGTKDPWDWDVWRHKAPTFTDVPMKPRGEKPFAELPLGRKPRAAGKHLVIDLMALERGQPHWLKAYRDAHTRSPRTAGGPGSGNFGHGGRPGEVGGSTDVGTTSVKSSKAIRSVVSAIKKGQSKTFDPPLSLSATERDTMLTELVKLPKEASLGFDDQGRLAAILHGSHGQVKGTVGKEYATIHNHPGGDPWPSVADIEMASYSNASSHSQVSKLADGTIQEVTLHGPFPKAGKFDDKAARNLQDEISHDLMEEHKASGQPWVPNVTGIELARKAGPIWLKKIGINFSVHEIQAPKTLGGPGSGNFGHGGRPGEVGGSSSEGVYDDKGRYVAPPQTDHTRPSGPWDANLPARNSKGETSKFIGHMEGFGNDVPLYNIDGGPDHGTTVTAETLRARGIAVHRPAKRMARRSVETLVHAAADAQHKAMHTAVMSAFTAGQAAVNMPLLRSAISGGNRKRALSAVSAVPGVIKAKLRKMLPKVLLATHAAGGHAGVKLLKRQLRHAGGPGSGNFGHGGRPGEVGGSGDSTFTHETTFQPARSEGSTPVQLQEMGRQLRDAVQENPRRLLDPLWQKKGESSLETLLTSKGPITNPKRYGQNLPDEYGIASTHSHGDDSQPMNHVDIKLWLQNEVKPSKGRISRLITYHNDGEMEVLEITPSTKKSGLRPPTSDLWQRDEGGAYSRSSMRKGVEAWAKTHGLSFHVARWHDQSSANDLRTAAIELDWDFDDENDRAKVWAEEHAAELAKGLSDTTREEITAAVMDAFDEGGDTSELISRVTAAVGDESRGELIARSEVMRAASEGQREAWRQGVEEGHLSGDTRKEWIIVGDDKVCAECESLDGAQSDLDGQYPDPGGDGPPQHPRCLPGHCFVLPGSGIAGVSKRAFDGDLVVIRVSKGRELSCTPNHPVLTPRGWVAAGMLNIGDNVICDGRSEWGCAVYCDHQQMPAAIENVADTFIQSGQCTAFGPVPTTTEDFHGDGGGSEVAVIYANRRLAFGVDTSVRQPLIKLGLIAGHLPQSLSTDGEQLQFFSGLQSSHAGMRGMDLMRASNVIHARPFNRLLLRLRTHDDAVFNESPGDEWTASAELARQLIDGCACKVFTDQIVFVDRFAWRGHVYNLETVDGWYAAAGILTQNCRCTEGISAGTAKNLGGAGSGNFGHSGRPGEVGGSGTLDQSDNEHHRDIVERRSQATAETMGFDASRIRVVDETPRPIQGRQFRISGSRSL